MDDDFDDFDGLGVSDDQDDAIPCRGSHRGVPLHAGQPAERLKVVRRDIDRTYELSDVGQLFDFACDVRRAPEARLFAAAKLTAMREDAVEKRWERPAFNRDRLKVMTNALDSRIWRHPYFYGTILDPRQGKPRIPPLGVDD
jgi:hypothetical protein